MKTTCALLAISLRLCAADFSERFEEIKKTATPAELYAFLFALPKGGDLHHHNGLSAYASVWYAAATSAKTRARTSFYTMARLGNCSDNDDALPRFYTVERSTYESLNACKKALFDPIEDHKAEWISSVMLDKPGEGRDEFFERIGRRLGELQRDPLVLADVMVENLRLFGAEGVRYIESQFREGGFKNPEEVNRIVAQRLEQPDALATGVQIRFLDLVIRFAPNADQQVEQAYAWVAGHRDKWVGINFAGREDNDKGYALRFLPVLRRMRRTYGDIPLSIHAGEKDSPGHEVRDTLLLGASRIGHGVNLITDPDTMLLMRNSHYLVEINLISNQKLEYVSDIMTHPFPEYLRFGIPVCLNTDDRGSWDSNMTDEYYTAVSNFHLTWSELVQIGRNSLTYSFAEAPLKEKLLREYDAALAAFETRYREHLPRVKPLISGYAERTWGFHE
jgi:adenosine deaminase CECR1